MEIAVQGKGASKEIGGVQYVLQCAEKNITKTGAVLSSTAADVDIGLQKMLDQKYKLMMNMSRFAVLESGTDQEKFAKQEDMSYLKDHMDSIGASIEGLLKVKGLVTDYTKGMQSVGTSGSWSGQPSPPLPWRDANDEKTWIPYAWTPKRPELWIDYDVENKTNPADHDVQQTEVALSPTEKQKITEHKGNLTQKKTNPNGW
ncbi:unnamed protein product [Prorocentrum cordatum]|uniref:F-actin-capping protein subunit beta n=1 Tax=Prorocentrum cordatum TaxID=2364126 RepID=A0ABN9TB10_9DINO|nr:unnamed protein product [Polarella glacialis]